MRNSEFGMESDSSFIPHSAFRDRTTIHPGAGMYVGDPLFDQWRAEIEAYRQQIEDDPKGPRRYRKGAHGEVPRPAQLG
jgi:hypothetical protein